MYITNNSFESKFITPIELHEWINDWFYIGLSFDYGSSKLFIVIKSFSSVRSEIKSHVNLDFVNFKLQPGFEIILGGIESKNSNNFSGILYDWNFATYYMETSLEFGYLMGAQTDIYQSNGIWLGTDFSFENGQLELYGKESSLKTIMNTKLKKRLNSQINELNSKDAISKGIFGINLFSGESINISSFKLSTRNEILKDLINSSKITFGIKKFLVYLNFSFTGVIGDEMKLLTSSNYPSINSFSISIVERAKEDSYKQFLENGVNIIFTEQNKSSQYSYDSSRNLPKVLKLEIKTSNSKIYTFLSPIQISSGKQYKVMIGFFIYKPNIIRAFFEYENQFIFSHEESDLHFEFNNINVLN